MAHEVVGLAVARVHALVAVVPLGADFLTALTGPAQWTPEVKGRHRQRENDKQYVR